MSKRLTYFGSVVIALTMLLTACQPTPTAKVVINFWHMNSQAAEGAPMQAIADAYIKIHPNVEINFLWDATLDKALAAITANNAPDLIQAWGPQFVGSWAYSGALEPLDGYFNQAGFDANDILPGLLKSTTWKGKVYGLPFGTDMSMLYYNADMFKAAGLDPSKPPTTIEELVTDAEKMTVVDNGAIKQIGWLPDYGWTHVGGDGSITIRYGAPFFHEDGSPAFDDPRWVEVFDFAKSVYDEYGADNIKSFKAGFGGYGTAQDPLCMGQLAMSYDGEWAIAGYKKNCPQADIRVAPFPYPAAHPDLKDNFEMGGTTIVMPSTAPNKAESWKFLAFMMQPENVAMFCLSPTLGNIPSSLKALNLYDTYKGNLPADFKSFIDLAQTAKPTVITASPISDEEFTELSNTEELIYSGKVSVVQGLKDLQDKLMAVFTEKVK
jgi:ABC-type glycerol-3-phosphate transport system substrate-binding protein